MHALAMSELRDATSTTSSRSSQSSSSPSPACTPHRPRAAAFSSSKGLRNVTKAEHTGSRLRHIRSPPPSSSHPAKTDKRSLPERPVAKRTGAGEFKTGKGHRPVMRVQALPKRPEWRRYTGPREQHTTAESTTDGHWQDMSNTNKLKPRLSASTADGRTKPLTQIKSWSPLPPVGPDNSHTSTTHRTVKGRSAAVKPTGRDLPQDLAQVLPLPDRVRELEKWSAKHGHRRQYALNLQENLDEQLRLPPDRTVPVGNGYVTWRVGRHMLQKMHIARALKLARRRESDVEPRYLVQFDHDQFLQRRRDEAGNLLPAKQQVQLLNRLVLAFQDMQVAKEVQAGKIQSILENEEERYMKESRGAILRRMKVAESRPAQVMVPTQPPRADKRDDRSATGATAAEAATAPATTKKLEASGRPSSPATLAAGRAVAECEVLGQLTTSPRSIATTHSTPTEPDRTTSPDASSLPAKPVAPRQNASNKTYKPRYGLPPTESVAFLHVVGKMENWQREIWQKYKKNPKLAAKKLGQLDSYPWPGIGTRIYTVQAKTHPISDDYDIDWSKRLGTGISGPVRPCTHRASRDACALKCLTDSTRARQEVRLHLLCSSHKHIVAARDVFINRIQLPGDAHPRNRLLVVMDLMSGGELFDRIKAKRSFTEREASEVMNQVVSAVRHLHSQNIAHRDLKPENLLLRDKSDNIHIELTDFGFAKIDNGTLQTPQFTPYYVAPQVLEAQRRHQSRKRGGEPSPYTYDKSCDIWSLGVIMYIMLCGYPPFYSESPTKSITSRMKHRITAGQYEFPTREWEHVSDSAKELIRMCLYVDVERRIDIEEMSRHPWLRDSGSVPHVELCSPSVMLEDEEGLYSARAAHSAQLTEMRIDANKTTLKPIGEAKNRLIMKRDRTARDESPHQVNLRALRDLLAYLTMPPPQSSPIGSFHLCVVGIIQNMLSQSEPPGKKFDDMLGKHGWNGNGFDSLLDCAALSRDLMHLIQSMTEIRA
eukprot:scpid43666/ scgid0382/ MAP kinase-activated protein kinase 5; p38-regulated/activated protein kinase